MRRRLDRLSARDKLEGLVIRLASVTSAGFKDLGEKINIIADSQIKADARIAALAEAQGHTDERLNVLIGIVEKYFSNGRNGK
jgi:hypothetical protein